MKPKTTIFGLFWFVSVFRIYVETIEINRTVSNQTERNRNNLKFSEKYQNLLSFKLFRLVFCLFRFNQNIETRCFGIEFETTETNCFETNRNKPKQPETTHNEWRNTNICPLSVVLVGLLFVSVQSKHQNKHFVSDSAETSFGSSFGCFESKLVSKDTLHVTSLIDRKRREGGIFDQAYRLSSF